MDRKPVNISKNWSFNRGFVFLVVKQDVMLGSNGRATAFKSRDLRSTMLSSRIYIKQSDGNSLHPWQLNFLPLRFNMPTK